MMHWEKKTLYELILNDFLLNYKMNKWNSLWDQAPKIQPIDIDNDSEKKEIRNDMNCFARNKIEK